jgi:hypothetical protein
MPVNVCAMGSNRAPVKRYGLRESANAEEIPTHAAIATLQLASV